MRDRIVILMDESFDIESMLRAIDATENESRRVRKERKTKERSGAIIAIEAVISSMPRTSIMTNSCSFSNLY